MAAQDQGAEEQGVENPVQEAEEQEGNAGERGRVVAEHGQKVGGVPTRHWRYCACVHR